MSTPRTRILPMLVGVVGTSCDVMLCSDALRMTAGFSYVFFIIFPCVNAEASAGPRPGQPIGFHSTHSSLFLRKSRPQNHVSLQHKTKNRLIFSEYVSGSGLSKGTIFSLTTISLCSISLRVGNSLGCGRDGVRVLLKSGLLRENLRF